MLTQMTKAFAASFFLIVGTLAMFEPAAAEVLGTDRDVTAQEIA